MTLFGIPMTTRSISIDPENSKEPKRCLTGTEVTFSFITWHLLWGTWHLLWDSLSQLWLHRVGKIPSRKKTIWLGLVIAGEIIWSVHWYSFNGKFYQQRNRHPFIRFSFAETTASLTNVQWTRPILACFKYKTTQDYAIIARVTYWCSNATNIRAR